MLDHPDGLRGSAHPDHWSNRIQVDDLASIFGALREGVLVLDNNLRVIALNPAAEQIMGRPGQDLIGSEVCELFGDHACPRDMLAENLKSGQPIVDFQTKVRLADDGLGHVLLRTVPLQDREGRSLGVSLLLGDVTEVTSLRQQMVQSHRLGAMVGRDSRMRKLFRLITDVADSEATVLIRGESGTGKELVARALHQTSRRSGGPFVQVNCSALSENLLESELFGHVRGAFTGAVADRNGRFAEADGGTLFLDEIGDVSPVVQVKLLRVLQERVVERVGDNRPIPVNVRVVSATNRDLEAAMATGRLREDFYYRIRVVSLTIPPLRERREDISLLIPHLLERMSRREGHRTPPGLSGQAMRQLMNHLWPGNVRELENALEHALVLSRGQTIEPMHLPPELTRPASDADISRVPLHTEQERDVLLAALDANAWHRTRTARQLGMDRTTLWRKIREYNLTRETG